MTNEKMNKKLLKLKKQLSLAIERNDAKLILQLQKKMMDVDFDENELEELNMKQ